MYHLYCYYDNGLYSWIAMMMNTALMSKVAVVRSWMTRVGKMIGGDWYRAITSDGSVDDDDNDT